MTIAQIENVFSYHPPHGDQAYRYEQLRDGARRLAHTAQMYCPESRELSIALTKLQEFVMFANAAIAINESAPTPAPPTNPSNTL